MYAQQKYCVFPCFTSPRSTALAYILVLSCLRFSLSPWSSSSFPSQWVTSRSSDIHSCSTNNDDGVFISTIRSSIALCCGKWLIYWSRPERARVCVCVYTLNNRTTVNRNRFSHSIDAHILRSEHRRGAEDEKEIKSLPLNKSVSRARARAPVRSGVSLVEHGRLIAPKIPMSDSSLA